MKRPAPDDKQWEVVWCQLRLYVHGKYQWFHRRTGWDLDELVHQAIVDTMEGRYPPADQETELEGADGSLLKYLCDVVDEMVKKHRRTAYRLCELDDNLHIPEIPGLRRSFRPKEIDLQELAHYKKIVSAMRDMVRDDHEVDRIIQLWAVRPALRPRHMARLLDLTPRQMRNALKRLRRRLKKMGGNSDDSI